MERVEHPDPRRRHDARPAAAASRPQARGHRHRRGAWSVALLVIAAVVLTACGTADRSVEEQEADGAWIATDDAGEAPMEETAPSDAVDTDSSAEAGDAAAEEAPRATTDDPAPRSDQQDGRAVIRTAHMHVRARDTAAAADTIGDLVADVGGYVSGTDLARDADGVVSGRLTLRVPTDQLTDLLDAIDDLADSVLERRLDEEDVTTQLSDLDARITNLEAYEEELRQLLTEVREASGDTEDLLRVFDRVNEVRAEIDQATARRAVLADQVALSTVQLQLSPTPATGPLTDPAWAPGDTARSALATTMRILADVADAVIRIALTVLPVAVAILAPIAVLVVVVRRVVRARRGDDATEEGDRHGADTDAAAAPVEAPSPQDDPNGDRPPEPPTRGHT